MSTSEILETLTNVLNSYDIKSQSMDYFYGFLQKLLKETYIRSNMTKIENVNGKSKTNMTISINDKDVSNEPINYFLIKNIKTGTINTNNIKLNGAINILELDNIISGIDETIFDLQLSRSSINSDDFVFDNLHLQITNKIIELIKNTNIPREIVTLSCTPSKENNNCNVKIDKVVDNNTSYIVLENIRNDTIPYVIYVNKPKLVLFFSKCVGKVKIIYKNPMKEILDLKVCPEKICPEKVCPEKICPEKICPEKICPEKICPEKICPEKICPEKICPEKESCPNISNSSNNNVIFVSIIICLFVLNIVFIYKLVKNKN
jgi:hypothetical protein